MSDFLLSRRTRDLIQRRICASFCAQHTTAEQILHRFTCRSNAVLIRFCCRCHSFKFLSLGYAKMRCCSSTGGAVSSQVVNVLLKRCSRRPRKHKVKRKWESLRKKIRKSSVLCIFCLISLVLCSGKFAWRTVEIEKGPGFKIATQKRRKKQAATQGNRDVAWLAWINPTG